MAENLRCKVLSLYRALLRSSKQLKNYGFREYAIRRTKDAFHAHKNETNEEKIQELWHKGLKELQVLRRQALINYMYQAERLVIEENDSTRKPGWINVEDIKKNT
ncbi:unnamed protein product [Pneumocystis jirovecii]|uniref:Complex 1 LYR protein domain-containing protein n=1 Tax=Pneumocystis jirovecii TaxID=42068 RepID=L0PC72_PNEJI|nr:unnamed protein product [Pneumocystis jirovecii]